MRLELTSKKLKKAFNTLNISVDQKTVERIALSISRHQDTWYNKSLCFETVEIKEKTIPSDDMEWHGKKLRNRNIYTSRYAGYMPVPKYKTPTYACAYIKIFDYLERNPESRAQDILKALFNGSNFDTFKPLANYEFVDRVDPKAKRNIKYVLSKRGKKLLDEAKYTKPAHDLVELAKLTKSNTPEELLINCTLHGKSDLSDPTFNTTLEKICKTYSGVKNYVSKHIPYINDYLKIISQDKELVNK